MIATRYPLVIGSLVCATLLHACERPEQAGVEIVVRNESQVGLESVKVNFTGGSYRIASLQPGGVHRRRVNPSGESHLELLYTLLGEGPRTAVVDTYFERDYEGTIEVRIRSNGGIEFEQDLKVSER